MPDILDQLRQQYGQAQDQQVDVSSLPELAEQGPRVGKLSKPGLDWLPAATASLKMMISDDPERLAKMIEGTPGIKIGHAAMSGEPYAEIDGQKYQFNRKGMSQQDIANFTTTLVTQMGIGKALKIFPALRGTTFGRALGRETIAGGLTGSTKEIAEQDATGEQKDAGSVIGEGAIGAAGSLVSAVLGSAFGRLFKQGASFLVRGTRELTETARRALHSAGVDPASLDRRTLDQADTILRQQVGSRPTPNEMVEGVARSDIRDTGIGASAAQRSGDLGQEVDESKLAEGVRGTPAQKTMTGFQRQQQGQFLQSVEDTAMGESPGSPRVSEAEAGGNVRTELQARSQDAKDSVDALYQDAATTAQGSGITVDSNWDVHGPQFQLRNLGMADVNEGTAPKTAATVQYIQRQFEAATERARAAARAAGTPAAVVRTIQGEFTPVELEGIRKGIAKAAKNTTDPTDKEALISLRERYDDFLNTEVGGAGGPDIIEKYGAARDFHAERMKSFTSQGPRDVGGKVIEKTIEGSNVDQGVIDSMFGNGNKLNPNGVMVYGRIADTLGHDNPNMEQVRQTMVRRVIQGNADAQAKGALNPQTVVNNITSALEGRGAQYVQQTLGPETLRDLQVLQRHLGRLVRSSGASNPPRSGFLSEAAMRAIGRLGISGLAMGSSGTLGAIFGGPVTGVVAGAIAGGATKKGLDMVAASSGRRAAEKAIRMAPMLGPVGRLAASARPVTGPIGAAGAGLLPPMGTPTAESLFDTYGPDLDLTR